jgi:hypothetical protein
MLVSFNTFTFVEMVFEVDPLLARECLGKTIFVLGHVPTGQTKYINVVLNIHHAT